MMEMLQGSDLLGGSHAGSAVGAGSAAPRMTPRWVRLPAAVASAALLQHRHAEAGGAKRPRLYFETNLVGITLYALRIDV